MPPSHAAGPSEPPLLEETIGAALRRVAAAQGDREALVARHQGIRLSYAELDAASDRLACALLALGVEQGDRIGIWAPNCAEWVLTQFATARIGAVLVNINPAYRTTELRYALAQSGCRALIAARAFKSSDYVAMVEEVRPELPALADVFWLGGAEWDALLARAGEVGGGHARRARGRALPVRPDQHPVHERHDRRPEGRDALAPQHPQQRLPGRRRVRLRTGGPRLHPGALLPLLRHGHGQPRRGRPRRVHGHPGRGVRAGGDARRRRRGALHVALRRADDVHRRARRTRPSRTTTCPRCGPGSWPARRARSR